MRLSRVLRFTVYLWSRSVQTRNLTLFQLFSSKAPRGAKKSLGSQVKQQVECAAPDFQVRTRSRSTALPAAAVPLRVARNQGSVDPERDRLALTHSHTHRQPNMPAGIIHCVGTGNLTTGSQLRT